MVTSAVSIQGVVNGIGFSGRGGMGVEIAATVELMIIPECVT